jgi:hypothetical protein
VDRAIGLVDRALDLQRDRSGPDILIRHELHLVIAASTTKAGAAGDSSVMVLVDPLAVQTDD